MSVNSYMGKLEIAIGSATLVFAMSVHAAEYYTWVDENGVTNYSERNPQGYSAEHVTPQSRFGLRYSPPRESEEQAAAETDEDTGETTPNSPRMSDADVEKHIAGERARIDAEIAKAKESNCKIGKRNLAQLEAYARIRVKDDNGQERVLTDSEKSDRVAQARQTIRENCTG